MFFFASIRRHTRSLRDWSSDVCSSDLGTDGYFQSIAIDNRGAYSVTAAIPKIADVAGGLTNNRLRAAGTSYPPGIEIGRASCRERVDEPEEVAGNVDKRATKIGRATRR